MYSFKKYYYNEAYTSLESNVLFHLGIVKESCLNRVSTVFKAGASNKITKTIKYLEKRVRRIRRFKSLLMCLTELHGVLSKIGSLEGPVYNFTLSSLAAFLVQCKVT